MNKSLHRLTQRRESLIAKIASQRNELTQNMAPLHTPLAVIDKGLVVLSYIKRHPTWIAAAASIILITLKPAHLGKWLGRGWVVWKMAGKLRGK